MPAQRHPDDPRRFLDPAVIARTAQLDLRAKHAVEGFISGMHKSPFFGHSVEFVQHREYVRGDDLRHLDWKVWSKTDRYYIKQFEAETNVRCMLVVDVSESMRYGRGPLTKYEYGCTLAASLGYLILRQQDSVGLMAFDSAVRQIVPARSAQTHIDALVHAMHVAKPQAKTDLEGILRKVAESSPHRSLIVIISDLLTDREPFFRGLEMLKHRRHDVLVFHILDDDEVEFPFAGTTRFEGMEELPNLLCDPKALREGYLEALEEYLVEVRRGCSRRNIDYTLVRTGEYLDAALAKFLNFRLAAMKSSGRAIVQKGQGFSMFSLFLNPYTMIAGAALVSSPIIIHLINRMRFRRVPWAAMEFLLKSQKRNRRRRIIEQIILLLLRITLVLLVGLLLARFISDALAFVQPQSTVHVVVLDDTASMGDAWRTEGERRVTFDLAKQAIVEEIAQGASLARTPQSLDVIRLSELDSPFHIERINADSVEELRSGIGDWKPTALHLTPIEGVRKAKELFDRFPNSKHVLHVVSDFRHGDWAGSAAEALAKEIGPLTQAKGAGLTAVHLLDVADPVRSPTQSEIRAHDNIGVVDLQPATKVAAQYMPQEFSLTVGNFSPAAQRNVRIIVRVNGQPREDSSLTIVDLKPGINQATFTATFDQLGINQISATVETEESGLVVDNVRYATVEVRPKSPILFIEGDLANRAKPESDAYYLRALFIDAAKGFDIIERGVQELETPTLEQYPCIFVLNVPRLNEKARANLEAYVRAGGGVFFALGDAVDADFYNQRLYVDGRGLFPCPLESKPTTKLTDVQKVERIFDPAMPPKMFPRSDTHAILNRIYRDDKNHESNTYLRFLLIDQYFPVPRARWNVAPGSVDEILTLPNYRSIDDYKESTQQLLNQIPVDDAKYATYSKSLKDHQRRIKDTLANGKQLYQLAAAIDGLLSESADPRDPGKPDLRTFWQQPAMIELGEKFARLMESVRFGDPLLVGKRFGRGPVLAYLTSAGSAWNDFPNGPARPYFVMLMLEVQRFLAGAGFESNRLVGAPFEFTVEANRYSSRVRRFFVPEPSDANPKSANAVDLGEQVGTINGGVVRFVFTDNRRPGLYRFDLLSSGEGGRVEQQAVAFNVDTLVEGDLRRASRADIEAAAPGAKLHSPGSGLAELLRERRSDLSESPWLFLLLLLVLVAEQAMAVRLSYHIDGNPAAAAVQAGARANA